MTKIWTAGIFLLLLVSCATQQKKPIRPIEPDNTPKLSGAHQLSEDISLLLAKLEGQSQAEVSGRELELFMEGLLDRYLALPPEEQRDPRLQGSMERLFDASRKLAINANMAPETVSGEEPPAPEDELLEVTTFLSPDELKSTLDAVSKAKERLQLGIQIPEDNDEVLAYVRVYQTKLKKWFTGALERGGPYVPEMKRIFKDEGVPPELVYLGIVESAFKTNAKSRAKALGMWQFMEGTAKNYGLTCDFWEDERLDPWESARASAKYLRTLHSMFNDWNFALASYNCGEGKVIRYLRKFPGKDYWAMRKSRYLRRETKEYVPAILASILIASDPSSFGMESPAPARLEPTATIPVDRPVDLRVLARHLQIPVEVLSALNPSLKRIVTPPRLYDLKVPASMFETADQFLATRLSGERPDYVVHTVRKGETIKTIARKYKSDPVEIQSVNLGTTGRLRRGTQILVFPGDGAKAAGIAGEKPVSAGKAGRVETKPDPGIETASSGTHTVRKGDTLGKIARKYGTTVQELCSANRITAKTTLRIGQKIRIP